MTASPPARSRHLVLLRHAKSAWPHGVPDHDRPLAGRGRRNAQAVGRWFAGEGPRLDVVLCSDARRAQHTWEIVAESLRRPPRARVLPELYDAGPDDVLALVGALPEVVSTVLVVGHEPTMSRTALRLAGPGSQAAAVAAVREKYPTNGIAVIVGDGPWGAWAVGGTVLRSFVVPRSAD